MATLIQSKQIEGVVTASVIEGTFTVQSGSVDLGGATGVTGSFSGSFIGDGSQLAFGGTNLVSGSSQITISQTVGYTAFSSSIASSIAGIVDTDDQTLSFNQVSKELTISDGNSVDLSSLGGGGGGGGSSIWTTGSDFYKVSSDLQVTGSFSATSLTGSIDYSNLTNLPSGIFSGSLIAGNNITITSGSGNITITSSGGGSVPAGTVSGSEQITFSGISNIPSGLLSSSAQLTDGSNIVSGSVLRTLDGTGVVSGSVLRTLDGTDVVSGSVIRTFDGTGILSGSKTDISSLNTYTSSADSRLASIEAATGSYLTSETDSQTLSISGDQLTISTGNTVTIPTGSSLPSGVVSGSSQITDGSGIFSGSLVAGTNITINQSGNNFEISSSGESTPAGTISSSAQVVSSLPDGVISGSSQLPSGLVSESAQTLVHLDGTNIFSGSFIPGDNITITSGSGNITITAANDGTSDYNNLINVPSGIVSGSTQITDGSNIVSGSVLRTLDGTDVVSGSVLRTLDGTDVVSGSVLRTLDGTDVVSGSVLRTLDGTNVFSGSVIGGTNVTVVSGSGNITINSSAGASDFTTLANVPDGLVSGSSQITDGSNIVSGSVLRTLDGTDVLSGSITSQLPSGVVSGSSQITDGSTILSGSIVDQLPSGVVSGSSQITDGSTILSGSILPGEGITINSGSGDYLISSSFNGNRLVSNTNLPSGIYNNNFGTSGSVQAFLESVFFPNTAPSISTGNQTIQEFSGSSSVITTLVATDAEGQTLTFGTASAYTDDLVRVSSDGVMTLNALATSASFNIDSVGGVHGHLVTVTAADTFDSITEKDIYIIVTPNEAPKFRETSVGGNVITSVTSNLNENSANDTLVKRVFFTDAEGDTITITTSSIDNDHFDVTVYSNYLDIRQNTASLDYETQTTYTFSITASDEHYENSQDSVSRTFLPITVNVTDNLSPTVNNQVVGSINENSSNGAIVGTVSVSDSEGDSVSAPSFVLHKLLLDGSTVASSSYGGTLQLTDPHENPFEINSGNRQITRKNGVYLNSDLINEYQYRVKVKDNFNGLISSASVVTINVNDDTPATLTDNWSAGPYIKESELSGTTIKTTDYGSTQADYNANQSGTWSSSNSAISINSNGNLSLNVNLSGSDTGSGDTIDSTISFTNTFGTITTDALSVSVVANDAPTISFTNQTSNLNTNLATTGTTMVSMSVTDTEGDTPFSASLTGTDASSLQLKYVNANSSSIGIQAATNLSAATYNYNIRITDDFGKSRDYTGRSFVISAADTGTLGGDTTSYIIESGENGDSIRDVSGFNAGNQSQMSVSYSPNYGSQVVQGSSWTSSNPAVSINTSGQLSLALDISGSDTGSGDDIVSTIGFQDQYGNSGIGTVTVNVFDNQAPTATFTDQSANFETDLATTGTTIVSMSISDTESDTPFSASLTGTNASSLQLVYVGATSASVGIQASTNLTAGTYNYNVKVSDDFGKSRTYSGRSFTIVQSSDYGKTYIYRSNYGSDAGLSSNYNALMGASTVSGDTPPEVTAYTANGSSPYRLISSSLGDASLSLAGGYTATRVAILSGSDLDTIISESNPFTMGNTAEQYLIIAPSGSDMVGIPTSMTDGFGDNTVGRYVMAVKADGGSWGQETSTIHLLDTVGEINGYDKHFVIGRNGHNSAASVEIRLIEASGSLPS